MQNNELWNKEQLAQAYPCLFKNGIKSVNYFVRHHKIPIVKFSPRGPVYFSPVSIKEWINSKKLDAKK